MMEEGKIVTIFSPTSNHGGTTLGIHGCSFGKMNVGRLSKGAVDILRDAEVKYVFANVMH